MHDKNVKKVILICSVLILSVLFFSSLGSGDNGKKDTESELESMLSQIDGVDEVSVIYYYAASEEIEGVAVVYHGNRSSEVSSRIYELVNALYDIPYNRIYVSN